MTECLESAVVGTSTGAVSEIGQPAHQSAVRVGTAGADRPAVEIQHDRRVPRPVAIREARTAARVQCASPMPARTVPVPAMMRGGESRAPMGTTERGKIVPQAQRGRISSRAPSQEIATHRWDRPG